MKPWGCAIVRIFFRETGMLVHTGRAAGLYPLRKSDTGEIRPQSAVQRIQKGSPDLPGPSFSPVACWHPEPA